MLTCGDKLIRALSNYMRSHQVMTQCLRRTYGTYVSRNSSAVRVHNAHAPKKSIMWIQGVVLRVLLYKIFLYDF